MSLKRPSYLFKMVFLVDMNYMQVTLDEFSLREREKEKERGRDTHGRATTSRSSFHPCRRLRRHAPWPCGGGWRDRGCWPCRGSDTWTGGESGSLSPPARRRRRRWSRTRRRRRKTRSSGLLVPVERRGPARTMSAVSAPERSTPTRRRSLLAPTPLTWTRMVRNLSRMRCVHAQRALCREGDAF